MQKEDESNQQYLPTFFSNLAFDGLSVISLLDKLSKVPSLVILSMLSSFYGFTDGRKFVNIPPAQRSVTYGICTSTVFSATMVLPVS